MACLPGSTLLDNGGADPTSQTRAVDRPKSRYDNIEQRIRRVEDAMMSRPSKPWVPSTRGKNQACLLRDSW